ncbi:PEPxxWA-CTERM sorting domain-containing protein [Methyloversatilis thermotolerans]|uniref:PEPxxWA-CTERM sorting domain-containing protein n=1 Tax=Methyloversatilis thermotolerans TaxID=1346290 RepID=UPI00036DE44A|nr:PEPxxWA-CTERM sorting domain-containing protein [Methyloversatilis thermotolerans]
MKTLRQLTLGLALASCFGSANAYINIVFDYTYDTNNFFTADRRATLEQAAAAFETRVFDTLDAITSTPGGNSISLNILGTRIENANIAKNELRIYVNSAISVGSTAGEATPISANQGGMGVKGDTSYINASWSRGQTGWPDSEVGTWGGSITYDSNVSWYADSDVSTIESFAGQWDLYTATLKGLVEIMGVSGNGVDTAYREKLNGLGNFNGDKAKTEYDVRGGRQNLLQAIPTEKIYSHETRLAANIKGDLTRNGVETEQLALLAWGLSTGERRYMTDLDWAIMDDIGWDVTGFTVMPETPPIPEPQTWAMLAAGLGLIGYTARKRRMM